MTSERGERQTSDNTRKPEVPASSDTLRALLTAAEAADPADTPDVAGAISAILAARLEGTPVPDEVVGVLTSMGAIEAPHADDSDLGDSY